MSVPYYDIAALVDALTTAMSVVVSDEATEDGTGMVALQDIFDLFLPARFESTGYTITAGNNDLIAHGLGVEPFHVIIILECISAEFGFSIGDRLIINPAGNDPGSGAAGVNRGISVVIDDTNISVTIGSTAGSIAVLRNDTGAVNTLTNANWELYVKAQA